VVVGVEEVVEVAVLAVAAAVAANGGAVLRDVGGGVERFD
jgi:hypothetical protein